MELRHSRQMKAAIVVLFAAASLASAQISLPREKSRPTQPFYDVKTEVRVEGAVQAVRFEPRYEGTASFLILDLEERATNRRFLVEISPAWFFARDIHQGERMKILGSLVPAGESGSILIAREIQVQGETIQVRDARGFPNWRGGPRQMGKRKRSG